MHRPNSADEPNYYVIAQLCEPKYEAEWKYLQTEKAFVKRKLASRGRWRWVSLPALGVFSAADWRKYGHELDSYAKRLHRYAEDVEEGVLPVKFAVYNRAARPDGQVRVAVHVEGGRIDERLQAPARPARLDAGAKPWPKLLLPGRGFARSGISITKHSVAAELSQLGGRDGARLIKQLLHVHCGPETQITYEIASRNVAHETGEVEFQQSKR